MKREEVWRRGGSIFDRRGGQRILFYSFGLRRRGPDALWTDSDIVGSPYYAGESSVLDVLLFVVFLCFFWGGDLDCAGVVQTHI